LYTLSSYIAYLSITALTLTLTLNYPYIRLLTVLSIQSFFSTGRHGGTVPGQRSLP